MEYINLAPCLREKYNVVDESLSSSYVWHALRVFWKWNVISFW